MTEKYIGRFAPSPTGPLHFGSLVAALASYLDAKAHQGAWLVRMEDVDETRCKTAFADDILRTLQAFGLQWDGEVMLQSQRKSAYEQALARLFEHHHTYACVCSRREIADSAALNPNMGIEGPVYPGTCRTRHLAHHCSASNTAPESADEDIFHANNATHNDNAIRIQTNNEPIIFTDRVQGECTQRLESDIGDFIIKRRDGLFAYQLAVLVDDAAQGITHIVRGADLIDSTARQIYLQRLLGFSTPHYLHIPVVTNAAGQKLSKQTLAAGISVADVNRLLIQALTFLGQSTMAVDVDMPTDKLLQRAVSCWQIGQIAAVRGLTFISH